MNGTQVANATTEAVLFDLDDTLHDDSAAFRAAAEDVAGEVAAEHEVDARALADAYVSAASRFWQELSSDRLAVSMGCVRFDMWNAALAESGIHNEALAQLCAAAYDRYRRRHLKIWPDVPELLRNLRAQGRKLGLITNGFAETHREKIAILDLEHSFDAIFIADEVGMVKPDPRLFLYACSELVVDAGRAVMVGDRYDRDIRGAREAGLRTIWLNVRNERLPDGAAEPDVTVAAVGALGEALRTLCAVT
jgi:putative hydrolase of the HAD superfamily